MSPNQQLVAMLRRMADEIERDPTPYCFTASASGRERVCIDMRLIDEQQLTCGPKNYALFIGEPSFVDAAPSVDEVRSLPSGWMTKGKK